jgi:hypothetical protein
MDFLGAVMGEEGLRAAMQAASRASLARGTASRQEPMHQAPKHQEPVHQEPIGTPITNNSPGRPEVRVVGRSRPAKPIQSVKSKIMPEPDQVQSAPPVRKEIPEH